MKKSKDPMGRAIADYYHSGVADRLRVFSPMFDEDEIPVDMLFRGYDGMSAIEQRALDEAHGKVLDVGAGAGCHSLVLQQRDMDVTAIDISPLSVDTMRKRGIRQVLEQDFFLHEGRYDTILMLMNGIGIVGKINRLPQFFRHLDHLLAPGGQLLCDSSDISYVFEDEDGNIEYPESDNYYGELVYQMQYKDTVGDPFEWLYVDEKTLRKQAEACGYTAETIAEGDHYEYMMRITRK